MGGFHTSRRLRSSGGVAAEEHSLSSGVITPSEIALVCAADAASKLSSILRK